MNNFKSATELATPDKPVKQNWFNTSGHKLAKSAIAKKQYEGQLRSQNTGLVDEPYLKEGSHQADVGFFREAEGMPTSSRPSLPSSIATESIQAQKTFGGDVQQSPLTPQQSMQQVQDVNNRLPVRGDYNDDNYSLPKGYLPDNDPKMIQRRNESQEVQAGRMKFIKDSQAGMYGNDARGSGIATSGMRASDARGSGDSDFDKRHARQNKIADAATMNAQANAMRAQQGGELGQAELVNRAQQAQLGRQSAERIAGAKSDQANTLAQRKSALDQEKLSGDIKHRAGAIMNLPNYRNLVAAINSKKPNSPGWQAAKEEFLRSTGMDFDTHNSVVAPKLNQGF